MLAAESKCSIYVVIEPYVYLVVNRHFNVCGPFKSSADPCLNNMVLAIAVLRGRPDLEGVGVQALEYMKCVPFGRRVGKGSAIPLPLQI